METLQIDQASIGAPPVWVDIAPIGNVEVPTIDQLQKALNDVVIAQKVVNDAPSSKEALKALAIAHRNSEAVAEAAENAQKSVVDLGTPGVQAMFLEEGHEGELAQAAYSQAMLVRDLAEKAVNDGKTFMMLPPQFVTAPKSRVDLRYEITKGTGNYIAQNIIYGNPMLQHAALPDISSLIAKLQKDKSMVYGHIEKFGSNQGSETLFAATKAISTGTDSGDIAGEIYHPSAWETWRHKGPWMDGRYARQFPTPYTDTVNLFAYVAFPDVGAHAENAAVTGSDWTSDTADIAAYAVYETTTLSDKIIRNGWQGSSMLDHSVSRLENAIYFKLNEWFTTGDGTDKPSGITAQITSGNANNKITVAKGTAQDRVKFNPADLSTKMWQLQSAYRRQEGCTITFGSEVMPGVLNAKSSDYYLRQMIEEGDRLIRVDTQAGGVVVSGKAAEDMAVVAGTLDGWKLVENEHLGNDSITSNAIIGYAGLTPLACVVRNGPFFINRQGPSSGQIATNNYVVGVGIYSDMVVALHGAVTSGNLGKGPLVNIVVA